MSDAIANVSQLIQNRLVDETNSVGRIRDESFSAVSGSQVDDTQGRQPDITTPLLREQYFDFVQDQQDFQDFLIQDQIQDDILRQQDATSLYQDQVDQRRDDRSEPGNSVDVRG